MFRFGRRGLNGRSDKRRLMIVEPRGNKQPFRCESLKKSDEGAAREIVHDRADDCVSGDPFENRRAAGDDGHTDDQHGRDDGDDLLDALLASADTADMLADTRAAAEAYAAALDDQVGAAFGAFDFGSQGHRGTTKTLRATEFAGKCVLERGT
jgi:hypothetical protein